MSKFGKQINIFPTNNLFSTVYGSRFCVCLGYVPKSTDVALLEFILVLNTGSNLQTTQVADRRFIFRDWRRFMVRCWNRSCTCTVDGISGVQHIAVLQIALQIHGSDTEKCDEIADRTPDVILKHLIEIEAKINSETLR